MFEDESISTPEADESSRAMVLDWTIPSTEELALLVSVTPKPSCVDTVTVVKVVS